MLQLCVVGFRSQPDRHTHTHTHTHTHRERDSESPSPYYFPTTAHKADGCPRPLQVHWPDQECGRHGVTNATAVICGRFTLPITPCREAEDFLHKKNTTPYDPMQMRSPFPANGLHMHCSMPKGDRAQ